MAQVNINVIAPAINQMVRGPMQQQFETQKTLYNAVDKRGKKDFVNGKGERIPSIFRRPTGITAGTEGFSFNRPDTPKLDDMYVFPTALALPYEISGRTIRNLNAGQPEVIVDGLEWYMSRVSEALTKDIEFNMFGDGSGQRAYYSSDAGVSSGSVVVTFTTAAASTFGQTKGAVQLEIGATYDIINSSGASLGTFTVTSKTNTTATGTTGLSALTGALQFVHTNGYLKFPRGLAHLINNDTGVVQLLSRSTYPQLKCSVTDLAGANITVSDFNQMVSLLQIRGDSGKAPGLTAIMPFAQHAALVRLGQNLKRFAGTDQKFDGSFQEFAYGDVTVLKVVDGCEDRTYFAALDDLFICEEMPFGDYNLDGNTLRMKVGTAGYGSDSWTGAIGVQFQLAASQFRRHGLIKRASTTGLPTQTASQA